MSLPNWWGDWRQNLTPHTGDLQPTDLIECTSIVAGQPVNTAITGQQIINAASGGGSSNPTTLASIVGSNLLGTANVISAWYLMPGGTVSTNNSIYIRNLLTKRFGSTTSTGRIYLNTTLSLTGATLLATAAPMNSTTYIQRFERNFYFDGTSLYVYNPTNAISTDLTTGSRTLVPFNPATDYYLIFAVQNSSTTPDDLGHKRVIIQLYN
jgi:hypothetical protein